LLDHAKGKHRRHLAETAVLLTEACCMPFYRLQVQMAITALERVLRSQDFATLEARASTFILDEEGRRSFKEILGLRHDLVHQGWLRGDADVASQAQQALMTAWILLDAAAAVLDTVENSTSYTAYLDAMVTRAKMKMHLSSALGSSAADRVDAEVAAELSSVHHKLMVRVDGS
jgi:hypothetical protein